MPAHALPLVERIRSLAFRPGLEEDEADEIGDLIDKLVATREWRALPHVAAVAFSTERFVAAAAGAPVANLLSRVPLAELPTLDRALRQGGCYTNLFASAWWELRPGALPRSRPADPTFAPLTRLAMCHPNGRVREPAVRRAALAPGTADLPFLLLRAADWVAAIRAVAAEALAPFLESAHAATVVRLLPLFELVARGRRLERTVADGFAAVLASREGQAELEAQTRRGDDPLLRRLAYKRLLSERQQGDRQLIVRALTAPDESVRKAAVAHLRAAGALAPLGTILRGDSLGAIRALGLELLPPGAPVEVGDYLGDRSGRVRRVARRILTERGLDVAGESSALVRRGRGRPLAAALTTLAAVAAPVDAELARLHLGDRSPRVRAAALVCLAAAGADDRVDRCLAALADPAPRVARIAGDLLADREYWRQIAVLLRAPPSARITAALARWIARRNRVAARPTSQELSDARAALARAHLDPVGRAAVSQILGS